MGNNVMEIDGVEIYYHRMHELADEFIERELDGKESEVKDNFPRMIFYIRDGIEKPSHEDIKALDDMFEAYVRLCIRYNKLPTVEMFSILTRIHRSTFDSWRRGEYRKGTAHPDTVKRWTGVCKSFVIDRLHNQPGASVNLIFTAKSCYQMYETAPIAAESYADGLPQMSREEIAARFAPFKEEPERLHLE